MPSFDVVSKLDTHELTNAIDQANREISNRFDFKGTNSKIEQKEELLTLIAPSEFQITQIREILDTKLSKREIDVRCLDAGKITESHNEARQEIVVRQGINKDLAKKIVKIIKETKIKVQGSIQGEQVRVTGKKRDDLQNVIGILKKQKIDLPLQFENFRD